ncbi:MAG: TIGR00282 family metallophosphoesterase [Candidatus Dormibacteraeota bacterium]|uniref:TIGR00282 family metallophosphoesterase n=1 Tax=Candidatus Dormiibacter inghamiae TaxID=3127013 RepID=A0A934NH25_9BACT|nr:TIGR00282 family metallophosphoesterase [Candidatus Dormibacteraeota bacterium]MBJ7607419.1 TIGR00282 family metallophosphoesterase [Candidatus Dormibacteraeota bacterium]
MSDPHFQLLFVADVYGRAGRETLAELLPQVKAEFKPDLTVVNGENAAAGHGLTGKLAQELRQAGADVLTTGNHVWDQKTFLAEIEDEPNLLRPYNYPPGAPGIGCLVIEAAGLKVLVMNLQGRIFMPPLDDPFRAADEILAAHPDVDVIFCDFHAEATSEKQAFGWHLDGRASAVVGTHTHVPTADHRVLPGGTAYVTDVGMVGPRDSVIGADKESALRRFLTGLPHRFEAADGVVTFNSVLVTISRLTGRAVSIQRIDREHLC